MLRYFNLWLSLGYLLIAAICYVSLTPTPPSLSINIEHLDKIEHFMTYFILMLWFSQLYKTTQTRLVYAVVFVLMGVTLETLQALGGVRYFEYYDMLANTLGVVLAWAITKKRFNNIFFLIERVVIK